MLIINSKAEAYCNAISQEEPVKLKEINRDTYANVLNPRMLSGHYQGRILSMYAHLVQAKLILEIGTYTGYSAICLAEGLAPNGKLISIDNNEEHHERALLNIQNSGYQNKIQLLIGNADNIIPTIQGPFDLVFIDADKLNYSTYYDLLIDRVRSNGLIICDNVLWDGKVFDERIKDKTTTYLRDFNQKLKDDARIQIILLPIRDGLLIGRKL